MGRRKAWVWDTPLFRDALPEDREFWLEKETPPYFTSKPLSFVLGWDQRTLNKHILDTSRDENSGIPLPLDEKGYRRISLWHIERLAHYWLNTGKIDYQRFASILLVVRGIAGNYKLL